MFLAYLCERETKRVTSPFPFEIEDTFTPRLDVHIQGKNLDLAFVTPEMLLFVWSCHSSLESILDVGPSPGTHVRHPRKFFAAGYGFLADFALQPLAHLPPSDFHETKKRQ